MSEKILNPDSDIRSLIQAEEDYFIRTGRRGYLQCLSTDGSESKMQMLPGQETESININFVEKSRRLGIHEKMSIRNGKDVFGFVIFEEQQVEDELMSSIETVLFDSNPEI